MKVTKSMAFMGRRLLCWLLEPKIVVLASFAASSARCLLSWLCSKAEPLLWVTCASEVKTMACNPGEYMCWMQPRVR